MANPKAQVPDLTLQGGYTSISPLTFEPIDSAGNTVLTIQDNNKVIIGNDNNNITFEDDGIRINGNIDIENRIIEIPPIERRAKQAAWMVDQMLKEYKLIVAAGDHDKYITKRIMSDLKSIREHIRTGAERQMYHDEQSGSASTQANNGGGP